MQNKRNLLYCFLLIIIIGISCSDKKEKIDFSWERSTIYYQTNCHDCGVSAIITINIINNTKDTISFYSKNNLNNFKLRYSVCDSIKLIDLIYKEKNIILPYDSLNFCMRLSTNEFVIYKNTVQSTEIIEKIIKNSELIFIPNKGDDFKYKAFDSTFIISKSIKYEFVKKELKFGENPVLPCD